MLHVISNISMMPIQQFISPIIASAFDAGSNKIFIKREDVIPFYFGGNKVRIADLFIQDMRAKGNNCLIAYGNGKSNLIRVLSNMCAAGNIPCCMIISDEAQAITASNNDLISRSFGGEFIACTKENVAKTVSEAILQYTNAGLKPYYIYGNEHGVGNEAVPVSAYGKVYEHILYQEKQSGVHFDYIFLASSTGMTQAGLIGGAIRHNGSHKIVGISTARYADIQIPVLKKHILAYLIQQDEKETAGLLIDEVIAGQIYFEDQYIGQGYGQFGKDIKETIKAILKIDGIALDPVYTGKAFYGMTEYLKEMNIKEKNILFIHTGGISLFYDHIRQIFD